MDTVLVAYYFAWLMSGTEVPELVGPYESWAACASVREWVSSHFKDDETGGCGVMPFPQPHSIFMNVFDIAPQYGQLHDQGGADESLGRLFGVGWPIGLRG